MLSESQILSLLHRYRKLLEAYLELTNDNMQLSNLILALKELLSHELGELKSLLSLDDPLREKIDISQQLAHPELKLKYRPTRSALMLLYEEFNGEYQKFLEAEGTLSHTLTAHQQNEDALKLNCYMLTAAFYEANPTLNGEELIDTYERLKAALAMGATIIGEELKLVLFNMHPSLQHIKEQFSHASPSELIMHPPHALVLAQHAEEVLEEIIHMCAHLTLVFREKHKQLTHVETNYYKEKLEAELIANNQARLESLRLLQLNPARTPRLTPYPPGAHGDVREAK